MGKKILIDASHPEETRVVVLKGNKVEDFDYESVAHKQLRGNIYLAKVTRVEPSLQAAFVDYGGNRHGFLAFSEIHPDYYQIPMADRQALLEEGLADQGSSYNYDEDEASEYPSPEIDTGQPESTMPATGPEDDSVASEPVPTANDDEVIDLAETEQPPILDLKNTVAKNNSDGNGDDENTGASENVKTAGSGDATKEAPQRRKRQRRYKIQEVIKRRQIILVQVVKEERGNKGASLTTYLSVAGRYCVLMPNTSRGGGVSRKISDLKDRKRLREVIAKQDIADGMGLIVRTAGANRTKVEIKRDYDYLLRLWESVRDLTLKSNAPNLVYEEGSLIKRSIRDTYGKGIDKIEVEGETAYREAKDLMKMLMPSHVKNINLHKDPRPLFSRNQIEKQLDALYSPTVTLPSGGYIVINQTEALVAVDINSGKSTREHNIEQTALKTNIEAAEETARQMRLRDLAGLIVIDFIDMEEQRNNRTVERELKEALKNDRARIQVGRISHFGLLEMSRQRMRTGFLEGSTLVCHNCKGHGVVRSVESSALSVLRGAEGNMAERKPTDGITLHCEPSVAAYLLNQKRDYLHALEAAYSMVIFVVADDELRGSNFNTEKIAAPVRHPAKESTAVSLISTFDEEDEEAISSAETDNQNDEKAISSADTDNQNDEDTPPQRRRRRRGRRGGRGSRGTERREDDASAKSREVSAEDRTDAQPATANADDTGEEAENGSKRGRKRRPRGGSRRGKHDQQPEAKTADELHDTAIEPVAEGEDPWDTTPVKETAPAEVAEVREEAAGLAEEVVREKPKRKRRAPRKPRKKASEEVTAGTVEEATGAVEEATGAVEEAAGQTSEVEAKAKKKPRARKPRKKVEPKTKKTEDSATQPEAVEAITNGNEPAAVAVPAEAEPVALVQQSGTDEPETPPAPPDPSKPKRKGWWQLD